MLSNVRKTPRPYSELGYWVDLRNPSSGLPNWMTDNLGDPDVLSVEFIEGHSNVNFNTTMKITAVNTDSSVGPVGSTSVGVKRLDLSTIARLQPRFFWDSPPGGVVKNKREAFNTLMKIYDLPQSMTPEDSIDWLIDGDVLVDDQDFITITVDSKTCPYYFGEVTVFVGAYSDVKHLYWNNVLNNTVPLAHYDIIWKFNALNSLRLYDDNPVGMPWAESFNWAVEAFDGPEGTNTRVKITPTELEGAGFTGECYLYYNRFDVAEFVGDKAVPLELIATSETVMARANRWFDKMGLKPAFWVWDMQGDGMETAKNEVGVQTFQTLPTSKSWKGSTFTIEMVEQPPVTDLALLMPLNTLDNTVAKNNEELLIEFAVQNGASDGRSIPGDEFYWITETHTGAPTGFNTKLTLTAKPGQSFGWTGSQVFYFNRFDLATVIWDTMLKTDVNVGSSWQELFWHALSLSWATPEIRSYGDTIQSAVEGGSLPIGDTVFNSGEITFKMDTAIANTLYYGSVRCLLPSMIIDPEDPIIW